MTSYCLASPTQPTTRADNDRRLENCKSIALFSLADTNDLKRLNGMMTKKLYKITYVELIGCWDAVLQIVWHSCLIFHNTQYHRINVVWFHNLYCSFHYLQPLTHTYHRVLANIGLIMHHGSQQPLAKYCIALP